MIAVSQDVNSSLLAELSNLNIEANNTIVDFEAVPVLEESVRDSTLLTPPRKRQNRNARRRKRKSFELNKLLENVQKNEKEKTLEKALHSTPLK